MSDDNIIDPYVLQLASPDVKEAFGALQVLKTRGTEALPQLLAALQGEDPSIRTMAVVVLGELGAAADVSIPHIVELLKEENEQLQTAAALTLVRIGPASIPALVEAIQQDQEQDSRSWFWAVWALSFLAPSIIKEDTVHRLNRVREAGDTPLETIAAEEALGKIIAGKLTE
ncbi:HEAT repeat domain-containing protein [Paenibacillus albidus]|uniref:HEAT repeat domain-containing protein n=1 Tax=Paenibacillus albidus TaxID=2041023 RepID=UPI001BE7C2CE|nr:HEAT repeat domain-containing protein [Paenibacillus albidus]MBT2287629.1 HEAT repeat domain-containing protein [Paenibacillus albidus]